MSLSFINNKIFEKWPFGESDTLNIRQPGESLGLSILE
jgi:hypothetical protein